MDHSFTLQAVMELHKSVGEMNAKLDAVKGSVDGLKSKVDDLVTWKHRILGGAAMAGFFVAGLGFIVGKGWDYVSIKSPPGQAPAAQSTGQPAAAPAQSTPPTTPRPAGP